MKIDPYLQTMGIITNTFLLLCDVCVMLNSVQHVTLWSVCFFLLLKSILRHLLAKVCMRHAFFYGEYTTLGSGQPGLS